MYYDDILIDCIDCEKECLECNKKECLKCKEIFLLDSDSGKCI